ncbi:hypothetical protein Q1695_000758 [Nippostrongylus brasiliensis]|nr:hypothetical protein Q1695_000758 [Nippostrongylus brasiliensis]
MILLWAIKPDSLHARTKYMSDAIIPYAVLVLFFLHFFSIDPNLQFLCRGSLSDYAACQCKEDEGEVACINAQFVDTEVFFNLNAHYKYAQ